MKARLLFPALVLAGVVGALCFCCRSRVGRPDPAGVPREEAATTDVAAPAEVLDELHTLATGLGELVDEAAVLVREEEWLAGLADPSLERE